MGLSRLRALLAGMVVVAGVSGVLLAQTQSAAPQTKPAQDEFIKGAMFWYEDGVTAPEAVKRVQPKYTPDGMRQKIQGMVKVQAVVATDGTVARARLMDSLSQSTGLDDAALVAAKQWTFKPGTLKDKAVPVIVEIMLEFRLH